MALSFFGLDVSVDPKKTKKNLPILSKTPKKKGQQMSIKTKGKSPQPPEFYDESLEVYEKFQALPKDGESPRAANEDEIEELYKEIEEPEEQEDVDYTDASSASEVEDDASSCSSTKNDNEFDKKFADEWRKCRKSKQPVKYQGPELDIDDAYISD